MLADRASILQYIPQREPMVMVHQLAEVGEDYAVTHLTVEVDNVFVTDSVFSEAGLVENIAQTAAVHVGYLCQQKNVPVPIGYIAAIKTLAIMAMPQQDALLTTTVKVTNKIMDITVIVGRVEVEGSLVCSCEMRIFAKF